MFEKQIEFFYGDNNSEVLSLIHPGTLEKRAGMSEELQGYIAALKALKGKTYALVNALSAGEFFGPNRNGDYFPEESLKQYHKTFEALGHVYKHHVNKDPNLSLGKVLFSHYNPIMHRVELILELDDARAADVIEKLKGGALPSVSMGCFGPGTKIVVENLSKKNIEDIEVGDSVVTHTGKSRKVTELHPRDYSGLVYTINPTGKYREPVTATKEHPWLVIEPDKFYTKDHKARLIRNKILTLEDAVWKTSEELTEEDYLIIPKPKTESEIIISNEKAKLLGWYLAEGYTHIKGNGVQFIVEENDQILKEIDSTKIAYNVNKINISTNHNCVKAKNIIIYNEELHQDCLKYCGKYSKKKKLHQEIFSWSEEAKLTFLGAYLSGDGFFAEGQAYASSANKELLEQLQWLGYSIGLNSTLGKNEHKAGNGFSYHNITEWILRFRGSSNSKLAPYCDKIPIDDKLQMGGKGGPFEYTNFYLVKIDTIDETFYEGPVYNFEVEEDNSYVVEQYAVHNCRVPWDECLGVNTPIMTLNANGGNLNDVQVGDKVLTHTGTFKKVLAKSQRMLDKHFILKPFGDYLELKGSEQHPFQIAKKEQFLEGKVIRKKTLKTLEPKLDWVEFKDLRVGDYLVFKKSKKIGKALNAAQARVLGYYVSEGFLIKVRNSKNILVDEGVSFSFNINERTTFAQDLIENLTALGYKCKIYEYSEKNECRVDCRSKELAKLMQKFGGSYSNNKKLHPTLFLCEDEILLNFLGAAINGDGSQDHNKQKGVIRYSSISEQLARDIRRVALEVGLQASISFHNFTNNWGTGKIFSVYIPASHSFKLAKYSTKVVSYNTSSSSRLFEYSNMTLIPIQKIEESGEPLLVQNLQIEEDESYQAAEYVTHNCSICGNRAKNRATYCEHLTKQMLQILPDGKRVYAKNIYPKFFDISIVLIPAEKTAGFLKVLSNLPMSEINSIQKLAFYDNSSYIKLAELDNTAEMDKKVDSTDINIVLSKHPKQLVNLARHAENKISDDVLYKLSEYSLNETLSTMLALRIMPTRQDFQKLALYSTGNKELADALEEKGEVFEVVETNKNIENVGYSFFNEKIAEILLPIVPEVSYTKELVIARGLAKYAQVWQQPQPPAERSLVSRVLFGHTPDPSISPEKNPIIPLGILGTLYYGYTRVFNNSSPNSFRTFMLEHPWLLPVLIGGTTLGTIWAQDGAFNKTAGNVDKFMRNSLISFPIAYYLSGKYENKAQKGIPISSTENLVRKHPALTALVGSLAATKAEKMLSKLASVVTKLPDDRKNELYIDIINLT